MPLRDCLSQFHIWKLWKESVTLHGRPCSLLALGVRVCATAMKKLDLEKVSSEQLVCVSEHDGCCVDAIQAGLHCTVGKKHLLFYKTGHLIFTVYDLVTGKSVRICTRQEIADKIPAMKAESILNLPEDELFYFEEARPMTERVRIKVRRACNAAEEGIPPREPGIQDSPDQFRNFDLPGNTACRQPRRK